MFIFIFILIAILASGFTVAKKDEFFVDYMSPQNTASINGIFSIMIFFSHASQYYSLTGVFDKPYLNLRSYIGQTIVVTYLLFSGYGLMESIKKKKSDYIKAIPFQRFFKLWYKFAILIVAFTALRYYVGGTVTVPQVLLAFTGYMSVGNSNWYMLITFALYAIIFISFMVFRRNNWLGVAAVFALTTGFIFFLAWLENPEYYYNTIYCLPLGMLFSLVKPYWDKVLMKNDAMWFTVFGIIGALFFYFADRKAASVVYYSFFSVFFGLLVVVLMMKTKIKSPVLDWFGQHIFSFFMLQRIPMILIKFLKITKRPYVFMILCFIATVVLATLFDKLMEKTDALIFKPKKKKEALETAEAKA